MTKGVKIGIAVAIVAGLGALAYIAKQKGENKATTVKIEAVEARDLVASVTASGQVRPRVKVDVSADITGRIIRLAVKEGDLVTKGQLLLQIDPQQYEAALGKPLGKLVNVAGRQRMLSQRMAMYYLAARLPVDAGQAVAEIKRASTEFVSAMVFLRQAQQSTPRIQDALQLADGQWVFFEAALQRVESVQAGANRPLSEVFTASENLVTVMDSVTGLYAAQRA